MASSNLPSLPTTLTVPQADMWIYAVISPFGAATDRKISANSLLSTITAAITDKSLQFDNGQATATVSAAGKGKIRYNNVSKLFEFSADTAAYASFGTPASPANSVQFNSAGAFGGNAGLTYNPAAIAASQLIFTSQSSDRAVQIKEGGAAAAPLFGGFPALLVLQTVNNNVYFHEAYVSDASTLSATLIMTDSGTLEWQFWGATADAEYFMDSASRGFLIDPNVGTSVNFGTHIEGTDVALVTSGFAQRLLVNASGLVGINKTSSIGAQLHAVSGDAARVATRIDSAATPTVDILQATINGTTSAGSYAGVSSGGFLFDVGRTRTAAQFDKTSSVALANITGLSVTVVAGKKYGFEAVLYTASNVAGGIQFAIAGTATATSVIYEAVVCQGGLTVAAGTQRATALATKVGDVTAVTTAYVRITGAIVINAGGALTVQFAQNTSNGAASSVLINSTFQVYEIPV